MSGPAVSECQLCDPKTFASPKETKTSERWRGSAGFEVSVIYTSVQYLMEALEGAVLCGSAVSVLCDGLHRRVC